MFLVAVAKWLEVYVMKGTTAARTIDAIRIMFSSFGLPERLVTDNSPQFVSAMFTKMNEIKHIQCAPYNPASNG